MHIRKRALTGSCRVQFVNRSELINPTNSIFSRTLNTKLQHPGKKIMDGEVTMTSHINNLVELCLCSLKKIKIIQRSRTLQTSINTYPKLSMVSWSQELTLVTSFLRANQRTFSIAGVSSMRTYDHITPYVGLLRDVIHWLPVPQHVEYTPCLMSTRL